MLERERVLCWSSAFLGTGVLVLTLPLCALGYTVLAPEVLLKSHFQRNWRRGDELCLLHPFLQVPVSPSLTSAG